MKRVLVGIGLVLAVASGASTGFAAGGSGMASPALLDDTFAQRKDVDEISRPKSPSGPASTYCSPGTPICP